MGHYENQCPCDIAFEHIWAFHQMIDGDLRYRNPDMCGYMCVCVISMHGRSYQIEGFLNLCGHEPWVFWVLLPGFRPQIARRVSTGIGVAREVLFLLLGSY